MRRPKSSARSRRRWAEAELSEECSTFLAGAYREYLEIRGGSIPAWAWINVLAHGTRGDIEVAASQCGDDTPVALVGEMAAAMVAALGRGECLVDLQRNTLIPLELALTATVDALPTSSTDLATAIHAALRDGLEPIRSRRSDP
jgi:hypothetical protein